MTTTPAPAGETVYFQEGAITITNARAVLGEKTYAMSNVTSVSMGTVPPNRTFGIVLVLLGLIIGGFGLSGGPSWGTAIVGLLVLGAGAYLLYSAKTLYVVKIGSSSGEANALNSPRQDYIQKIVTAMNEAIIKRG